MPESTLFKSTLPAEADAAVWVMKQLRDAGHEALLAGGCVRDLLLGERPKDYDVATDARPERVIELFRSTRKVGAQFGVVLVRRHKEWLEVATFRSDGEYVDGRRPSSVSFGDARADALRRDFTVNGMFLDPIAGEVRDYVGGRADLEAKLIRAIGNPAERFAEDYLRLLRAVRFAARLEFELEDATRAAIADQAQNLPQIAAERRREELSKMLGHPRRGIAFEMLRLTGLLQHSWPGADWSDEHLERCATLLPKLAKGAPWELCLSILLSDRSADEAAAIARGLACSNEERRSVQWLLSKQNDLRHPDALTLAQLKRLMASPDFESLCSWQKARHQLLSDCVAQDAALDQRINAIPADKISPPPLVTGTDLHNLGIQPGPVFRRVLEAIYTDQLNEQIHERQIALERVRKLLAEETN